jgi:hypothetical protein
MTAIKVSALLKLRNLNLTHLLFRLRDSTAQRIKDMSARNLFKYIQVQRKEELCDYSKLVFKCIV